MEFDEESIPHEESLCTVLALLSDLGSYISTVSSSVFAEQNIFPVTVLFKTARIMDYALVTTLYTDCILRIDNGACKNMLST